MTRFIIKVDDGKAPGLKYELESNYVFIGSVWSDKAEVLDFKKVTRKLIDDTTDQVMDIAMEGMELNIFGRGRMRFQVRKVIRDMLFSDEGEPDGQ